VTALEKQRASGAASRRHLHRGSSTLALPRLLQLHQIPPPPAHSRLSLSLHFHPAEAHLADLESSFDICCNTVETSSPDTGLFRASPCSSNRCGPAPPSHRHHFWWHTIKPRSVWIRTSGAWGQPSAVHADRTTTKSVLLDTAHEAQPVLPNADRNRAYFHPHPYAPDPPSPTRWLQQRLARSAEARPQVGDTEDAAVSSQCTVAEHRTLLLPALIHLYSLPPNCRVLASTAPTTLGSKNGFFCLAEMGQKTLWVSAF